MPALPDVPTLAEVFKTPDLVLDSWFGLWAPNGTPAPVVDTLFKGVARAYADPSLRVDSEAAGAIVSLSRSPAEFTQFMQAETLKLGALVKAAHLSAVK
jgi:tripartite-type tricarboxylate transporter receptor subunit TctC